MGQLDQRVIIIITVDMQDLLQEEDIHMLDMEELIQTVDMAGILATDMVDMVMDHKDIQVTGQVDTQAMVALATQVLIQDTSLEILKVELMDESMLLHL